MSKGAAGMDLRASEDVVLLPMARKLVSTGIFMELPAGYEAQVRPRSGLAINHGISLVNAPGTIDSDYRGEIKVILINLGEAPFHVKWGERIAQMVIARVDRLPVELMEQLTDTDRGAGGVGHTGSK